MLGFYYVEVLDTLMSKQGGDQPETEVPSGADVDGKPPGGVFERIADGFFALDEGWHFTYANREAEKQLGQFADSLVGENVWDLFPKERFHERFHEAMQTQDPVSFTEYYPPLESWFRIRAYPSESGLSVFFEDVTEQKQYEQVLDTIQDGIYVLKPDDEFVMVNDELLEMTGYDREELIGADASIIRDEQTGQRARRAIQEMSTGGKDSETIEHHLYRIDGSTIPAETRFAPYEYSEGEFGRTGVVRDISEREQREQALTSLHEVAQELPHATTREEIADRLVEAATDALGLPGVAVFLRDWKADELRPVASAGELDGPEQELPAVSTSGADSVISRAFVEGETAVHQDVAPPASHMFTGAHLRRGLFVPMGDEGILVAGDLDAGSFDDKTVEFAELLAANAESELTRLNRESTLRDRERELERYERIVETVDDGVYVVDEERTFQMVNDAFLDMVGRSREDVLGTHATSVFDEEFVERAEHLQQQLAAGERDEASLEYQLPTDDGNQFLECRFATFPDDLSSLVGQVCVVRDITDQKAQETRLRDRVRQQRVAAAFGRQALKDPDLDELFETAVTVVADTLDIEYAKVLDLEPGDDELLLRAGVGWREGIIGSATVDTEQNSQAGYTLVSNGPVIVDDLAAETRFDGPELLTSHDVTSGINVVIGSAENPWGVLGAHTIESRDFDRHDANFVQSIANTLSNAIERSHHEWALKHQGERLAALNHLNTIVREINYAVAQQSTRQEIEEMVCRRLANSSSYKFAWTGEVDWAREEVRTRHEVGVEGYLDGVTLPVDDSDRGRGPGPKAIRTGEMQVVQDFLENDRYELWHDHAREHGFQSVAAIPIHYDNTNYGVLCVYSERTDAFQGEEREVLEDLGEIIGHAIQSLERKRILLSDEVVELEVKIEDAMAVADGVDLGDEWIRFNRVVPTSGDQYLYYGEISDADHFEPFIEGHPRMIEGHLLDEESGRFVIETKNPPAVSAISSHGGRLRSAKIEGSDYRLSIELPPSVEARKVLDPIRESYSGVETMAQRRITREDDQPRAAVFSLDENLTDRQQAMLEAAYFGGYFEWPRASSAEDVATRMDVSAPTFHEHLRRAQQKVFSAMLDDS